VNKKVFLEGRLLFIFMLLAKADKKSLGRSEGIVKEMSSFETSESQ
tara:strand:- start:538 stop:675 length:138 start_codon:yes stop_codon:yes gene_type:complete